MCDGTCKSCNNYPLETCTYLVGDEADGVTTSEETYEGVCASTALVYIGFLVELGECQTFSDLGITPAPDVEDELEKEKEKETGKDNETDEMKAEASLTLTPTPTSTTTPTVSSSSSSNSSTNSNTEQNRENDEDGTNNNSTNDESITTPPSSVCIAADMLSHLPFDSLVFSTHRRAAVLCDTFGSCATPGHIVVHDGRAMTMRQYCETAGCKRTVKLVNSPRIGKGVKTRVGSRSPQMEFTALAARFDTFVERWALRMVVERFGF